MNGLKTYFMTSMRVKVAVGRERREISITRFEDAYDLHQLKGLERIKRLNYLLEDFNFLYPDLEVSPV